MLSRRLWTSGCCHAKVPRRAIMLAATPQKYLHYLFMHLLKLASCCCTRMHAARLERQKEQTAAFNTLHKFSVLHMIAVYSVTSCKHKAEQATSLALSLSSAG